GELSGGNQQKVILAKWLAREADLFLFDEPTRGIDVGAKFEIYELMNELVKEGKSIVMVSSELPEILGMSDRICVMREGKLVAEVENTEATTQEEILALFMSEEVAA
ncbi:MAG: ATP-binding cassette domain-containing protein, partial [Verrucomicrobiota bacterium]